MYVVYINVLPPKLLPPMSRPLPISEEELINSGTLKLAKPGSCVVYIDGAQAYAAVIKLSFPKLKRRAVACSRVEFVKPARPARLPSGLGASAESTLLPRANSTHSKSTAAANAGGQCGSGA